MLWPFISEAVTKIIDGGRVGLTATSTYTSKPLDSDSVPDLNIRILCSWSHFDNDANALMATDLELLLVPPFTTSTWAGSTNLADFGWERQLRPLVQHDPKVTVAYS